MNIEKRLRNVSRRAVSALARRPEREIVRATLQALRLYGVYAWRNQSGMMRGSHKGKPWVMRLSAPGVSDIVGFRLSDGKIVCVECKVEGAKPTAEQQHFLELVHAAGGIAIVARNVEDVRRVLQP